MKRFWFGRMIMFFFLFIAATLLFSTAVMLLWNAILPAVFVGAKTINFYQALGILVLSKILFGFGRGAGWHGKRHAWKNKWQQKWQNMTPEEREKFRAEWRNRCGGRWRWEDSTVSSKEKEPE